MRRQTSYEFNDMISHGLGLIPERIRALLERTSILGTVDPQYVGIVRSDKDREDGRSYKGMWCVSYPFHQTHLPKSIRETTLILGGSVGEGYPFGLHPLLVVHEMGHVLDYLLDFRHWAEPITKYAHINHHEAFAEAFVQWVSPAWGTYYPTSGPVDEASRSLFERLAVEGI